MMPEVVTHNYQILKNRWIAHSATPRTECTADQLSGFPRAGWHVQPDDRGARRHTRHALRNTGFLHDGLYAKHTLSIIGALIVASDLWFHPARTLRFLTRSRRKSGDMTEDKPRSRYTSPYPGEDMALVERPRHRHPLRHGRTDTFPEYANIFGTYKAAIRLHDIAGVTVSISFVLWIFYYLFIARSLVRLYVPNMDDIKRGLFRQAFFIFFTYFLGEQNPHTATIDSKFNAIQKMSYLFIMFLLLPLVIVSGLVLMNVAPLRGWIIMIGGIKFLVDAHYLIACSFCAFLCVHVYMATLGHTPFSIFGRCGQDGKQWKATTAGGNHEAAVPVFHLDCDILSMLIRIRD